MSALVDVEKAKVTKLLKEKGSLNQRLVRTRQSLEIMEGERDKSQEALSRALTRSAMDKANLELIALVTKNKDKEMLSLQANKIKAIKQQGIASSDDSEDHLGQALLHTDQLKEIIEKPLFQFNIQDLLSHGEAGTVIGTKGDVAHVFFRIKILCYLAKTPAAKLDDFTFYLDYIRSTFEDKCSYKRSDVLFKLSGILINYSGKNAADIPSQLADSCCEILFSEGYVRVLESICTSCWKNWTFAPTSKARC